MYFKKYQKYKEKYHKQLFGGAEWGAMSTQQLQQTSQYNLIRPRWGENAVRAGHIDGEHYGTYEELRPNQIEEDIHLHQIYTRSDDRGSPFRRDNPGKCGLFNGYVLTKQINRHALSPGANQVLTEIKIYLRCGGHVEFVLKTDTRRPVTIINEDWDLTFEGLRGPEPEIVPGQVLDRRTIKLRPDWGENVTASLGEFGYSAGDTITILRYTDIAWRAILDFYRDYLTTTGRDPMCQCGNNPYYYQDGTRISPTRRDGYLESEPLQDEPRLIDCSSRNQRARWKPHVHVGNDATNPFDASRGRGVATRQGEDRDRQRDWLRRTAVSEVGLRAEPDPAYTPDRRRGVNPRAVSAPRLNPRAIHLTGRRSGQASAPRLNPRAIHLTGRRSGQASAPRLNHRAALLRSSLVEAAEPTSGTTDSVFLQMIRDHPVDVLTTNGNGGTPLHVTALVGNLTRVKALLMIPGINVNQLNRRGFTPLDQAVRNKQWDVARLIYDNGGRQNNTLDQRLPWDG